MRTTLEHEWMGAESPISVAPWVARDQIVPNGSRLVIVAPHPDDETLMAGGLAAALPSGRVLLLSVTDGEASHGYVDDAQREALAARRRREQVLAFEQLGHGEIHVVRLGMSDGQLAACEDDLVDCLRREVQPNDIVVTTAPYDGHPDHDACGRACIRARESVGCSLWFAPVWLWHWQTPLSPLPFDRFHRFGLDLRQQRAKSRALACFRSQLGDDPAVAGTPIVPPEALAHFRRPFETFIRP